MMIIPFYDWFHTSNVYYRRVSTQPVHPLCYLPNICINPALFPTTNICPLWFKLIVFISWSSLKLNVPYLYIIHMVVNQSAKTYTGRHWFHTPSYQGAWSLAVIEYFTTWSCANKDRFYWTGWYLIDPKWLLVYTTKPTCFAVTKDNFHPSRIPVQSISIPRCRHESIQCLFPNRANKGARQFVLSTTTCHLQTCLILHPIRVTTRSPDCSWSWTTPPADLCSSISWPYYPYHNLPPYPPDSRIWRVWSPRHAHKTLLGPRSRRVPLRRHASRSIPNWIVWDGSQSPFVRWSYWPLVFGWTRSHPSFPFSSPTFDVVIWRYHSHALLT